MDVAFDRRYVHYIGYTSIADLANEDETTTTHLAEAIQY